MNLYLDSNIYDLIVKRNEVPDFKNWLRAAGHSVFASLEGNVTESLRAPGGIREPLVTAITRLARPVYPPYDYRHFREIASEIGRQRPHWFRGPVERKAIEVYLRRRKAEWRVIMANPAFTPTSASEQGLRISAAIGLDTGRQRTSRRRAMTMPLQHSDSGVQRCIDSRTRAEQHWRYVASQEVPESLNAEIRRHGHLEWLNGLIWPQPINEWERFWMCDVEADRVPLSRIIGLVEMFQRERKVTSGNSIDRMCHAPHMLGFDRLLTGDLEFLGILEQVVNEFPAGVLAIPVAIDMSSSSAVAAVRQAINPTPA